MGRGMRSRCNPPPQPLVLPLLEWLQKALGKDSAVCRKAAAAPWFAQVLESGRWPDPHIFPEPQQGSLHPALGHASIFPVPN